MKSRISQSVPFAITLIGYVIAPTSYWCIYSNEYCYSTWLREVYPYFINPLYNFSFYLLPVTILLIFVPRNIFNSWLKFAAWALPLSVYYIWTTPVTYSGLGLDLFSFYRDDAARLAGTLFAIGSLLVTVPRYLITRWLSARDDQHDTAVEPAVTSRLMLLASFGGLVCLATIAAILFIPVFSAIAPSLETGFSLLIGAAVFDAYAIWNLFALRHQAQVAPRSRFFTWVFLLASLLLLSSSLYYIYVLTH